jgi:hypothetical protein
MIMVFYNALISIIIHRIYSFEMNRLKCNLIHLQNYPT